MMEIQRTIATQEQQIANNMMAPPMQIMMTLYYTPAMQQQPLQPINYNNQQNMGSNQRNNKNSVKRYENFNYCHSCGFDLSSKHNSGNYPKRRPNHNYAAVRGNTMRGSNSGQHKTIMPSAAGKICQDGRDTQRNQSRQQNCNNRQQQVGYQQQNGGY